MDTTSVSLLKRLRQPCADEAWARFVDLYTPLIYYWARGTGLSAHDAADLVQDVLTMLVRKMPEFSYDPNGSFRGWLRTLTLNVWRKSRSRDTVRVRGMDDGLDEVAAPDHGSAFEEEEYRRHLVKRALELMQSQFQPTTWRACWASAVEGRSAEEVRASWEFRATPSTWPNLVYCGRCTKSWRGSMTDAVRAAGLAYGLCHEFRTAGANG